MFTDSMIVDRICQLMKRESESVGFIPSTRIRWQVEQGLFDIQIEQNEIVGYMIHGPRKEVLNVHQVVVDLSARRYRFASQMEARLIVKAAEANVNAIRLVCRDDLESNLFWAAAGYSIVGTKPAGAKRKVPKTVYLKELTPMFVKAAFYEISTRA